jgi:hypothetical protein
MIRRRRSLRDHLLGFRVCNRGDHIQWVGLILDRLQQATISSRNGSTRRSKVLCYRGEGLLFDLVTQLSNRIFRTSNLHGLMQGCGVVFRLRGAEVGTVSCRTHPPSSKRWRGVLLHLRNESIFISHHSHIGSRETIN